MPTTQSGFINYLNCVS